MAFIKCRMDFELGTHGWSEGHYLEQTSPDLGAALTKLQGLAEKRVKMCGKQVTIPALHVSVEGVSGDGRVASYTENAYVGNPLRDSSAPDLCVLGRKRDVNSGLHASIYLHAPYDEIEIEGGRLLRRTGAGGNSVQVDDYEAQFASYLSVLKENQFGWLSTDPAKYTKANVLSVTAGVGGQVTVTVDGNLFNEDELKKKLSVRLSGLQGCGNLNGQHPSEVITRSSFKIIKPRPIFAWTGSGHAAVTRPRFIAIDHIVRMRVVSRRVGKPASLSPAKSRPRIVG